MMLSRAGPSGTELLRSFPKRQEEGTQLRQVSVVR